VSIAAIIHVQLGKQTLCTEIVLFYSLVKQKLIFFTSPDTAGPQILKMTHPAEHPYVLNYHFVMLVVYHILLILIML
jgi:hypothetical protein